MSTVTTSNTVTFFYLHAGYSYQPTEETAGVGRLRCALSLADAERVARNAGLVFEWSIDSDADSSDFSDDPQPWALWECLARDIDGEVVASLHAIDFGRDGTPDGQPYARVVEAQLADEWITERREQ